MIAPARHGLRVAGVALLSVAAVGNTRGFENGQDVLAEAGVRNPGLSAVIPPWFWLWVLVGLLGGMVALAAAWQTRTPASTWEEPWLHNSGLALCGVAVGLAALWAPGLFVAAGDEPCLADDPSCAILALGGAVLAGVVTFAAGLVGVVALVVARRRRVRAATA